MADFLRLGNAKQTWNALGIQNYGITNGNVVAAQSSDICESNSAGTFLALVAFTEKGDGKPPAKKDVEDLAARIKPLLFAQGMPGGDLFQPYSVPEGRGIAPVVVVYEHQFLAYQARFQARTKKLDAERVLLYPKEQFLTQPQFIALNPGADRLGDLITHDPRLLRRATELGFRTLDSQPGGDRLADFLGEHDIPAPVRTGDDTATKMPTLDVLEQMIDAVGGCRPRDDTPSGEGASPAQGAP
ncbi:hypothetical protein OG535_10055 [Kitasatospora sp. NBC_00085]|uniref:hypothetical protein n=1 Tax=Kitasatospora sp. NBC_00085 TaxID=2903566 RepID=UPI0032505A58